MFGIAITKKQRRQKRYKKIRAIAAAQGRISFNLSDVYLNQLSFDVLDAIIAANTITTEQYQDMGITVTDTPEYSDPTWDSPDIHADVEAILDENAAKAAALEEYNQVITERELEEPEADYHRATSLPDPEPVVDSTPSYAPYTPSTPSYSPSSDDDDSRRSSGSSSGGSSDDGGSSYSSSDD